VKQLDSIEQAVRMADSRSAKTVWNYEAERTSCRQEDKAGANLKESERA